MKNHIESYNRWLNGQSSRAEFHELQKNGLDDPFIGDAIEGVELHHKHERSKISTHLDQRIVQHMFRPKGQTKVMTLWPYAIAAGLAILFGSIFFLRNDDPLSGTADIVTIDIATQTEDEIVALQVEHTEANNADDRVPESASPPDIATKTSPKTIVKPKEKNNDELAGISDGQATIEISPEVTKQVEAIAIGESPKPMAIESKKISLPEESTDQIVLSLKSAEKPKEEIIKTKDQGLSQLAKRAQGGKAALMQKSTSLTRAQTPTIYPEIGEDAFKQILKNNPFPKESLFMRGLKQGDSITISFDLDENRIPTNVDTGEFETEIIEKILQDSGKWIAPENSGRINYQLPLLFND